jgi:rfaE bifunctional protein kinase chain/domain
MNSELQSAQARYKDQAGRLCELVAGFEGRAIVVLGDLCLDEFLYAEISRVSREAPVLIVEHRSLEAMPGGGGNAVNNLRALGGKPLPVGVVGPDDAGSRLLKIFETLGIDTSGVLTENGYVTPVKTRVLAALPHSRPQQVVRIDRGAEHTVSAASARQCAEKAASLVAGASALLLSDYNYDGVRPDSVAVAVEKARNCSVPVTSDSRKRGREFSGVTAATPNLEEAEAILGWRLEDDGARLREAGERLRDALRSDKVLITRGSKGMLLFEENQAAMEIPAFGSSEVADVTGAGDTVIATFTLALAAGGSALESALLANAAAGLAVMKQGTATINAAELTSALQRAATQS